ncbi:spermidine synthase [Phenylobacterium sp. J367]|uniref:spermidine synthase n=1 Tax=Phenylobacterium sp. J367 TaxID=2898435 RepID=UPI002151FBA7|nr:fused MFS/spermidine synthase [Phenylobacterium sp. J367]MCR5880427.1 fused MFS/spermidine synthase [Phenylobacterium sp. J367]
MAFFQLALLAGYGYAHALQRLPSVGRQALVHGAALLIAALALPLRVNELIGPPTSEHPNLWLLAVLALSIGAPFAVLSATAPLVQAWHARTVGAGEGKEPYVLYAASNLGSLLALLAYPLLVEPAFTLYGQRLGWSAAYGAFVLLMAALAFVVTRAPDRRPEVAEVRKTAPIPWRERLIWVALAAIPSSLMLGVTTHITTDIASAPFIWVVPLALYLVTFIIAFQARPLIPLDLTLVLQAAALAGCAALLPFKTTNLIVQLLVHLTAFFLTALMCHQRLVARRPDPAHLTEFYLWLSVGGVVGGAFNAFIAPVIFNNVWEYPLVLALAVLARPWGSDRVPIGSWVLLVLGVLGAALTPILMTFVGPSLDTRSVMGDFSQFDLLELAVRALLCVAVVSAFLVRQQALLMFAIVAVISIGANATADRSDTTRSWRSFFGVLTLSRTEAAARGGEIRMLAHGTTLHGAQAVHPYWQCQPMVYYTVGTPIGQVFLQQQAQRPATRIGAVGLGTGSVAAYVRPGDHLTFFEIDPLVIDIANDPANFTYTTKCSQGPIDYVVGDARLTLAQQPDQAFDILLIDAFSSDAVPAHLLTVEAVRGYLQKLKPDGVMVLHLSNRNLELLGPAQAVIQAAGGHGWLQKRRVLGDGAFWEADEDAIVVGRNPEAVAAYGRDPRWLALDPTQARPWTDDYTNLPGALWRKLQERYAWMPG